MSTFRTALCSFILFSVAAPLSFAQGTYTQIDPPGSMNAEAYGIDAAGDISGSYRDGNGVGHGFLLSRGVYTNIDYPGATDTVVVGINDRGQVVGNTESSGFVYNYRTQSFTDINYPGGTATNPWGINNAGDISGWFSLTSGGYQGFELIGGGSYRQVTVLGSTDAFVQGIATSGEVVGNAVTDEGSVIRFKFSPAKGYRQLDIPNVHSFVAEGISESGDTLVGYYASHSGMEAGFLYRHQTLQSLIFPGAISTTATAVNAAGEVVGFFYGPDFITHGFTWSGASVEKK